MLQDEYTAGLISSSVPSSRVVRPSLRDGVFVVSDSSAGEVIDPISLHKYIYGNDDPVENDDPSGESASLDAAALGRAVHKALGADFVEKLDPFGISGPSIVTILERHFPPLSSFVAPITSRFPDLVDIDPTNKEVFEIKPANLKKFAAGLAQLIGYITLFNRLDPKGGWHEGDVGTYTPPSVLVLTDPPDVVAVFPPIAGIITYRPISEEVEEKAEDSAEAENAELDDALGIDTLEETLEA